MTLITLLICLTIERVAATSSLWQFEFYYHKMKRFLLEHSGKPSWLNSKLGMWIWLLVPAIGVQFVVGALDWLLFEFVFNVVVLLICIGCIEKRKTYKSFLNAAARNDDSACQLYAAKLQGLAVRDEHEKVSEDETDSGEVDETLQAKPLVNESETSEDTATATVAEPCGCETLGLSLVWYNFRYYCAVLFWFVVCGPAGAVLYCMVRETHDDKDAEVKDFVNHAYIQKALHVLDWLPARVFSAGYLLIGNFTKAAGIWLSYLLDLTSPAKTLVSDISKAAETIDPAECSKITEPACMLKLAKRNILFFLAMVALLTLYGGIR